MKIELILELAKIIILINTTCNDAKLYCIQHNILETICIIILEKGHQCLRLCLKFINSKLKMFKHTSS